MSRRNERKVVQIDVRQGTVRIAFSPRAARPFLVQRIVRLHFAGVSQNPSRPLTPERPSDHVDSVS